jgi:non-ribosomal peptide synthetase component F
LEENRPLFDTLFIWQETLRTGSGSLTAVTQSDSADFSEFNLTLEIEPRGDKLLAKATFQTSLLPCSQVELLLRQLDDIADIFVRFNSLPLDELDSHLNQYNLSIENPEFEHTMDESSLSSTIEILASQDPDQTAIEFARDSDLDPQSFGIERISYAQLNSQANQIAHFLRGQGVEPNQLVCVFMEKSINLYVSILAVIKAGAGYLPLTPQTPVERVRAILEDADVQFCLTESLQSKRVAFLEDVVCFEVGSIDISSFPGTNVPIQAGLSDLAYAVFTSGSTGKPKGVLITRGNIMSNIKVLSEIYPCSLDSKLLQSCSQAFDGKSTITLYGRY